MSNPDNPSPESKTLSSQREEIIEQLLKSQTQKPAEAPEPPRLLKSPISDELLILYLRSIIRIGVRILAILMTFVIIWGVIDVGWVIFQRLTDGEGPIFLLEITDILATFGAFMAVLIAIEIFVNITIYLRDDIIHVRIVVATALMAIARKVIIMDIEDINPIEIFAIAAVVLALSIGYWLVNLAHVSDSPGGDGH